MITGNFAFSLFREFGAAFLDRPPMPTVVDLRPATHISTAGVGMLRILRQRGVPEGGLKILTDDPRARFLLDLAGLHDELDSGISMAERLLACHSRLESSPSSRGPRSC